MRETIMVIGVDRYDKEVMQKVFSGRYDMLFIDNAGQLAGRRRGPFFKLVVYNMGIPNEENLDALNRLIRCDFLERPVIVITSQNTVDVDRFLAASGVFYHLVRPFELRDLDDLIKGALRFWQKKRIDVTTPVEPRQLVKK